MPNEKSENILIEEVPRILIPIILVRIFVKIGKKKCYYVKVGLTLVKLG